MKAKCARKIKAKASRRKSLGVDIVVPKCKGLREYF
jgi:hypothetical protein